MKAKNSTSILFLSASICSYSSAYEQPTHGALSQASAKNSIIYSDPSFLAKIGYQNSTPDTLKLTTFGQESISILELIKKGAIEEDDGTKSLNHFYNPLNDSPLTYADPSIHLRQRTGPPMS